MSSIFIPFDTYCACDACAHTRAFKIPIAFLLFDVFFFVVHRVRTVNLYSVYLLVFRTRNKKTEEYEIVIQSSS